MTTKSLTLVRGARRRAARSTVARGRPSDWGALVEELR